MRKDSAIVAVIAATVALCGCPAPEMPGDNSRLVTADPASPSPESPLTMPPAPLEPAAAPVSPPPAESPASVAPSQPPVAPPDEPPLEPPPVMPALAPGSYSGRVFLVHRAHCSGMYAEVAGAELEETSEWPAANVRIDADGLPDLGATSLEWGLVQIALTFQEARETANVLSVYWQARVDVIDPISGAVRLSLPGTRVDTYEMTDAGQLEIYFVLQAETANEYGEVQYEMISAGVLDPV